MQDDAVVGPDRVGLEAEALADARRQRQAPGGVHAPAVGREHAQPPVADLVAEALDARSCGRSAARASPPAARAGSRAGCARRARRGRSRAASVSASCSTAQRENAPIASPSSFGRPTESPFQNGTAPGAPGAGVTITRSRPISSIRQVDAPSRNVWPGPRLVDHLLVELADAPPVGQRDRVQPAVGDRAGVGDRELARALARADRAGDAVPARCARAARRTPSTGSGRRACRARSRAARARARRRSGCA